MKSLNERVREHINNPVFQKPISHLNKNLEQRGQIILVTRIKPQPNYGNNIEQHATWIGKQDNSSINSWSSFYNRIQRHLPFVSKNK